MAAIGIDVLFSLQGAVP